MSFRNMRKALLVSLLVPAAVLADFHYEATKQDAIDAEDRQLAAEIVAFLADYQAAYNDQDYRTVKNMWLADGNPIYLAEEVPFPLYGQERLNSYFNPVPGKQILEGIDNRYSEVRAKYVAPDIAVATYRLDYDIKLVGRPANHGWNRIMAVFVRTADGWKMTAYAEAPMGPRTMVRKMMQAVPAETAAEEAAYATTRDTLGMLAEKSVDAGFEAFLEQRRGIEPRH